PGALWEIRSDGQPVVRLASGRVFDVVDSGHAWASSGVPELSQLYAEVAEAWQADRPAGRGRWRRQPQRAVKTANDGKVRVARSTRSCLDTLRQHHTAESEIGRAHV